MTISVPPLKSGLRLGTSKLLTTDAFLHPVESQAGTDLVFLYVAFGPRISGAIEGTFHPSEAEAVLHPVESQAGTEFPWARAAP